MSSRIVLIVSLWVDEDRRAEFEDFERRTAVSMHGFGGRIERVVRVDASPSGDSPSEVHLVTFPDRRALERYSASPEVQALAPLRSQLVLRTEIVYGSDGACYPEGGAP